MSDTPKLVSLGRIVKPQGLKGEFRVYPHGQDSENLDGLEQVVVQPPQGEAWTTAVRSCRRKGVLFILSVEGIDSIEQVEALVGGEILAPETDLAELADGEYYWYELIGMDVVTESGERLGEVKSMIPTGANDVLQVMRGGHETLLPNIPDVILRVDREARVITVRLLHET